MKVLYSWSLLILLLCHTSYTLGFVHQQGHHPPGVATQHRNAKGAAVSANCSRRRRNKGGSSCSAGTTSALYGGGSSFFHESQRNDVYASEMHRDEMRMGGRKHHNDNMNNSMGGTRRPPPPPFRNPFTPYRRTPYDDESSGTGWYSRPSAVNDQGESFYGNEWERQRGAFRNARGPAMEERMFAQDGPYGRPSTSSFYDPSPRRNMSYGMKSPGYPRGSQAYSPQTPRPSWNRPSSNNMQRNGYEPLQANRPGTAAPPPRPPPYMNQAYYMQSPRMQQSDYFDDYYPQPQTMDPSFLEAMDRRTRFRPQRQPPRPGDPRQQQRYDNFEVPSWFSEAAAAAASSSFWRGDDVNGRFSPRRGMNRPPPPPFYPPAPDGRRGEGEPRWNPRSQQPPGSPFPWKEQEMFAWDPYGFPGQSMPGPPQNWGAYGSSSNNNNGDEDEYDFISPGENGFGPRSATRSSTAERKQRQPRTKGPMGPSFTEDDDKNIVVDVLPNHPPDAVFSYTVPQSEKARKRPSSPRGGGSTRNDGSRGPDPIGAEPRKEAPPHKTASTSARGTVPRRKKSSRSEVGPFGPSFTDSSVSREVVMGPKSKSRTSASKTKTPEERTEEAKIGVEFGKLSESVFIAGPSSSNGFVTSTSRQSPPASGVAAATPDVSITDDSDHRIFIVGGIPLSNEKTSQSPEQSDAGPVAVTTPNESPAGKVEAVDVGQIASGVSESLPNESQTSPQLSAYEQQLKAFYDANVPPPPSQIPEPSSNPPTNLVDNAGVTIDMSSDGDQRMQSFYNGGPPRK